MLEEDSERQSSQCLSNPKCLHCRGAGSQQKDLFIISKNIEKEVREDVRSSD